MAKLTWDEPVKRLYEFGVSKGVIYPMNRDGSYEPGSAWNGIISVTIDSSSKDIETMWADNRKYTNRWSMDQFSAIINAYTVPEAFGECIGESSLSRGIHVFNRKRRRFGLCYQTNIGNGVTSDAGYLIHFIYGAIADPPETTYSTMADDYDPVSRNWSISSDPLYISGRRPVSHVVVDSRELSEAKLLTLSEMIYGTDESDPTFPFPDDLANLHGYSYESLLTRSDETILTRNDEEILARLLVE